MEQREITIAKPFDAHVHLRSGKMLRDVTQYTSAVFPRAVVMGNLPQPIDDAARLTRYREEIRAAEPGFKPVMSVMLTRQTTVESLDACWRAGAKVLKFIPGGVSTGGAAGLDLTALCEETGIRLLEMAHDLGMVFSCHFEQAITHFSESQSNIPPRYQEQAALDHARHIVKKIPGLKMVVEHVSTKEMIQFVESAPAEVAATLTAHHAVLTYEDVCDKAGNITNGLNYCKPIAKTAKDRLAVRKAMVSGNPKFFSGSDSAPWPIELKRGPDPKAGIFMAPVALPLLAQIFEEEGALDLLEKFASVFGPKFYDLEPSSGSITLKKERWTVPYDYEGIPIFCGGQELAWKVA